MGCEWYAVCAEVAGIARQVPGLLGPISVCRSRCGYAVYAGVVRVAQHVPGSLGLRNICQGRWGHAMCISMSINFKVQTA